MSRRKLTKEEVEMKTESYYGGEEAEKERREEKPGYEKKLKKMSPNDI